MFHEVWKLKKFQSAKVTFKVIQGHWQWCHSIGHVRFLLVFRCNCVSILHRFRDIITYLYRIYGHFSNSTFTLICRRNVQNVSSKRPTRVGETSVDQQVCRRTVCRRNVLSPKRLYFVPNPQTHTHTHRPRYTCRYKPNLCYAYDAA